MVCGCEKNEKNDYEQNVTVIKNSCYFLIIIFTSKVLKSYHQVLIYCKKVAQRKKASQAFFPHFHGNFQFFVIVLK